MMKVSITLDQCHLEERSDEGPAVQPSNDSGPLGFTNNFNQCHPERNEGPAVPPSNDHGPPSGSPTSLTSVIPSAARDLLLRHQGEWRFYVYIMASRTRVLYTGMTNNLHQRVFQEKNDLIEGFAKKYKCHRLVHWESFDDVGDAINREKENKGWRRSKKVALIEATNPTWEDLAADWYEQQVSRRFAPPDDTGLILGRNPKTLRSMQVNNQEEER